MNKYTVVIYESKHYKLEVDAMSHTEAQTIAKTIPLDNLEPYSIYKNITGSYDTNYNN